MTGTKNPAAADPYVIVDAIDIPVPGAEAKVYPTVPQKAGTDITLAGRDAKILVANYKLGAQQLQYSTSEIMTHAHIGDRDVALLYGRDGQDGETVLRYAAEPKVTVLDGTSSPPGTKTRGDLRLNYKHSGLARVLVTGGERPLLLLLGTDEVAATFWRQQTASGPVLVRGPALLRGAAANGTTLALTGDTAKQSDLEVFAAKAASVTWNGRAVTASAGKGGSLAGSLPGPKAVTLPALTTWKHASESPEAKADFDDARWTVADKTTSNSITAVPAGQKVLFADDYGYHYGDLWYRGHFKGTGAETGVTLEGITGRAGAFSVWLNGTFVGSFAGDASRPAYNKADPREFSFPAGLVRSGADNVLSVLFENMGHNQDTAVWDSARVDAHKEARGLTKAALTGAATGITWKIQGAQGGEDLADKLRGPMNNGGLYGERNGWYKPDFADSTWEKVTLPREDKRPGVSWYRTNVQLDLPKDQDTSIGIRFDDKADRRYRVLVFVNGWQMGRYVNYIGPQHSFPIPTGVLDPNGHNSIALAVWNTDGSTGGLGEVKLESYGTQLTAVRSAQDPAPEPSPSASGTPSQDPSADTPSVTPSVESSDPSRWRIGLRRAARDRVRGSTDDAHRRRPGHGWCSALHPHPPTPGPAGHRRRRPALTRPTRRCPAVDAAAGHRGAAPTTAAPRPAGKAFRIRAWWVFTSGRMTPIYRTPERSGRGDLPLLLDG